MAHSVAYRIADWRISVRVGACKLQVCFLVLLIVPSLSAQDSRVDPTWLHRYVPSLKEFHNDLSSSTCHVRPIFGEGDSENHLPRTLTRFAEVSLDAGGSCQPVQYDREEEIYFIVRGSTVLRYGDATYPMRANDFTYLSPGSKHSITNNSRDVAQVLVIGFKIPPAISIAPPSPTPKIANVDALTEQTVEGHPTSVLYKLLIGPRTGKRDAINEGYVVIDFFLMDFAPGGTNSPHHHETAEEADLVLDGEGEMVAGGGMDGIEGRHPAKAGDAYYFRQNCTVGFYNQDKPGAKAHILAVRAKVQLPKDED
jgi:mannose-6-phosphate isomerase-like protein (cupin superfamily)